MKQWIQASGSGINQIFFQGAFSLLVVSLGQGSWIPWLGWIASAIGYACFWDAMRYFSKTRDRFWFSALWFMAVQGVQLSWLASVQYMGPLIFVVYLLVVFLIGLQFGALVFFFEDPKHSDAEEAYHVSLKNCLAIAGSWVLLEWVRIFFFTGFTWNPVGLALACSSCSIQFASLFGVYGLSFWVIFVNVVGFSVIQKIRKAKSKKEWIKLVSVWGVLAACPYLYGVGQSLWVEKNTSYEKFCNIALVQTGILPEQKDYFAHSSFEFIPPLNQWERIWAHLDTTHPIDLLVLPEAAVSLSAYRCFYPIEMVQAVWKEYFGAESLIHLPALESPLAALGDFRGEKVWKVSNAYIAQALSNLLQATLIIGFDDQQGDAKYNAAFCFQPHFKKIERYEKRILVPMGEYVPFLEVEWISEFLADQFGIGGSFEVGMEANPFNGPIPTGVSICLEETYSHLVRDLRLNGARLFVNISNDVWFPRSRLPEHHFQHGRIRAAENGVCLLRSCNTGITGAVDCFGGVMKVLPPSEEKVSVLYMNLPLRSFRTLYTWWGDSAILLSSALFALLGISVRVLKKLRT